MTATIQAKVDKRLLKKADRMFVGDVDGRIVELLQNARRAGATQVHIRQTKTDQKFKDEFLYEMIFQDNGHGIVDFQNLLQMGGQGWDAAREAAEDPAGVGFFSLMPREVRVSSRGRCTTIKDDGWIGDPVPVVQDPEYIAGTRLQFLDTQWKLKDVAMQTTYSGLTCMLNDSLIESKPFLVPEMQTHECLSLGVRIQLVPQTHPHLTEISKVYHPGYYNKSIGTKTVLNFHGLLHDHTFHHDLLNHLGVATLVQFTGQPSGLRLLLPARTKLVENADLKDLGSEIERLLYRYAATLQKHRLPYRFYSRARALSIVLRESEPVSNEEFTHGGDGISLSTSGMRADYDLTNAAVTDEYAGDGEEDFVAQDLPKEQGFEDVINDDEVADLLLQMVACYSNNFEWAPIHLESSYLGYSWYKNPRRIKAAKVIAGKPLGCDRSVGCGRLTAVESLAVELLWRDGSISTHSVPFAPRSGSEVFITPQAEGNTEEDDLLLCLGGINTDEDWEKQKEDFYDELDAFWEALHGDHRISARKLETLCRDLSDKMEVDFKELRYDVARGEITVIYEDDRVECIFNPKKRRRHRAAV